ncbi:hypothetical protein ACLBSM_32405, partial [Klebsiella pneumoniae]
MSLKPISLYDDSLTILFKLRRNGSTPLVCRIKITWSINDIPIGLRSGIQRILGYLNSTVAKKSPIYGRS